MIVCLVWILFTILCHQGIHATKPYRHPRQMRHSRCWAAHAHTALPVENKDRPTTSKACIETWTEFLDVFTTIDPHLAFEIQGIEACKTACIETIPGCVAIDVYPNITFCLYHLGPTSELEENRFIALQPGYKHLILNRTCSSGHEVNKETNQNQLQLLASIISPNNGDASKSCSTKWTIVHGVHSAGYHTHLGVYGEKECKKDCVENIPSCIGIELVKQYESCNYFIQPLEQLVKTRVPLEGHTQHILTRECQSAENINAETNQQMQPFIANNPAFKACTAKWTKIPDVFSFLYHRHLKTYGREACQKVCFESIPGCVAISVLEMDEIPLNKIDCLYFLEPLSQVVQSLMPFRGNAQYVLTRECPPDSPARNNETGDTALQILAHRPIALKSCTAKWKEIRGMCSFTADSEVVTDKFEEDCKEMCFDIPECVAVDVREKVTDSCYYHLETLEEVMKDRRPSRGCSQFILTRECHDSGQIETENASTHPTSQDLTSRKECTWKEHKDIYSFGASLYAKVSGIEACKTACIEEIAGCVAIEYHASPICWYHSKHGNFDLNRQKFPGRGFVQYVPSVLC